jgi:hypothetical protein
MIMSWQQNRTAGHIKEYCFNLHYFSIASWFHEIFIDSICNMLSIFNIKIILRDTEQCNNY